MSVKLKKGDKCQHEGCRKNATTVTAYDESATEFGKYCDDHCDLHIRPQDYEQPTATCPNCKCLTRPSGRTAA